MNNFLDILSKLIIATITFVAPMMIFCFGIFQKALFKNYEKEKKKKIQLVEAALAQMSNEEADKAEIFKQTGKQLESSWHKKLSTKISHPVFHLISIFFLLFFALVSLMFSYLIKDNIWNMQNKLSWKLFVYICCVSYFIAIILICFFINKLIIMKKQVDTQ